MKPELSIVILCYKEATYVPQLHAEMRALLEKRGVTYEIVLVGNYDEGSDDETPQIIRAIAAKNTNVVAVTSVKQGAFGFDVRSGLAVATGKVLGFIDGDGQNPFEDVVRTYDAIQAEKADFATTYRVTRYDGTQRIFISRIFNILMRFLFPSVRVLDVNSKPKLFTRNAYEKLDLHANDWLVDAEIVVQAAHNNFRITQIPTVFLENERRSSLVRVKTVVVFLVNLVYYRFVGRVRT